MEYTLKEEIILILLYKLYAPHIDISKIYILSVYTHFNFCFCLEKQFLNVYQHITGHKEQVGKNGFKLKKEECKLKFTTKADPQLPSFTCFHIPTSINS